MTPEQKAEAEVSYMRLCLRIAELEAQRDELLEALKHLEHNARKSGANMGLALDVASAAISAAKPASR